MRAGKSSRTDIAICYMNDRVDRKLLDRIISNIEKIDVDALTMNQESLSEAVYNGKWFNPFPKFRYTERPDTVAASVLEGQIAILVDNSPAAMLLLIRAVLRIKVSTKPSLEPLRTLYFSGS